MSSKNIEEVTKCNICFDAYNDSDRCPRMLSCGHSFCHSCLTKLYQHMPKSFIPCCPNCKSGIDYLRPELIPINFSLKDLIATPAEDSEVEIIPKKRKVQSDGFCAEHNYFKEMKCVDCDDWICGVCAALRHKQCNTMLAINYKEWKIQAYHKGGKVLEIQKIRKERITESLIVHENGRKDIMRTIINTENKLKFKEQSIESLIESLNSARNEKKELMQEIKTQENELKQSEKCVQELENWKTSENIYFEKLKNLQTLMESSLNDKQLSKAIVKLEKLLEKKKRQTLHELKPIPLPLTRESLEALCKSIPVYALTAAADKSALYGKITVKDGLIRIHSFEPEKPDAELLLYKELIKKFCESNLPKRTFFKLIPDKSKYKNETKISGREDKSEMEYQMNDSDSENERVIVDSDEDSEGSNAVEVINTTRSKANREKTVSKESRVESDSDEEIDGIDVVAGDESGSGEESTELEIEIDEDTARGRNFTLLCSAMKGEKYKGMTLNHCASSYELASGPYPVVAGIKDDDNKTREREGLVYGMDEKESWFGISLDDDPSSYLRKIGSVVSGLQNLKEARNHFAIIDCGVIV